MRRQLFPALVCFLFFTLLTGLAYPLLVTAAAQLVSPDRASGSLIERDGVVVASRLIGQAFSSPRYFHPRPSAGGYDAMASGASNLGPTNEQLLADVRAREESFRAANGLPAAVSVPVDALTASGSGLDPHISPESARLQARRVANARGLPLDRVLELVDAHTAGRPLRILGEPVVNVVELNLALDAEGR